ncbi:hypothetical protein PTTG_07295, partial [Puccinia triticina 1-1 BBBD Race 1]
MAGPNMANELKEPPPEVVEVPFMRVSDDDKLRSISPFGSVTSQIGNVLVIQGTAGLGYDCVLDEGTLVCQKDGLVVGKPSLQHQIDGTPVTAMEAALLAGLGQMKQSIRALVGLVHQQLNSIAIDFLASPQQGKHLRPLVVLSVARGAGPILPTQCRLAEIAELIPISLLYFDVINQAKSRREDPLRPAQVGQQAQRLPATSCLQEPPSPSPDELGTKNPMRRRMRSYHFIEILLSLPLLILLLPTLKSIIQPNARQKEPNKKSKSKEMFQCTQALLKACQEFFKSQF